MPFTLTAEQEAEIEQYANLRVELASERRELRDAKRVVSSLGKSLRTREAKAARVSADMVSLRRTVKNIKAREYQKFRKSAAAAAAPAAAAPGGTAPAASAAVVAAPAVAAPAAAAPGGKAPAALAAVVAAPSVDAGGVNLDMMHNLIIQHLNAFQALQDLREGIVGGHGIVGDGIVDHGDDADSQDTLIL